MGSGIRHLMLLDTLYKALRESVSDSLRNPPAPSASKHILPMETDILYVACSNKMYEQGIKERKGKKKEEKEKTEKGQKEGKAKNCNRKNT